MEYTLDKDIIKMNFVINLLQLSGGMYIISFNCKNILQEMIVKVEKKSFIRGYA